MAFYCHVFYFVLFLFINRISFTVGELPCHEFLTAVVQGKENWGVLTTNNFDISKPYYERFNSTHFKVCICTKVPCLRKCCPLGLYFGLNKTCDYSHLDIMPDIYTPDLQLIPDYGINNFHRVFGDTCKAGRFQLRPDEYQEDRYFLFPNGTLKLHSEEKYYDASQFCLENSLSHSTDGSDNIKLYAFVCFEEDPPYQAKLTVYPIGMIISMPFLLATFIVYSLPELRNLHGKNLMSHIAALLTGYIILVILQTGSKIISDAFCIVGGFLTQYSFLATFFWLNVMCFDIWMTFSGFKKFSSHMKGKENKKFFFYSLYAWGCPTIILVVTVAMQYIPNLPDFIIRPNIGIKKCFFETALANLLYFYMPMIILVCIDISFFILTAIKIYRVRKETKVLKGKESRRNDEASKQRYLLYLKLFLVMGINWAMEFISWFFSEAKGLFYATDVMNSLQGLFIFWIFVCNRKIKKILISRFCPQCAPQESETHTSSYKMSTSANSTTLHGDNIHLNNVEGKKNGVVL